MTSEDPNASQLRFDFLREEKPQRDVSKENIQADASDLAAIEKSALGEDANNLMEEIVDEVNMEMAWASVAPTSRARPKHRNVVAKATAGGAELSRGHSTVPRSPIETGRTEQ